jgi:hypothetical protein
MNERDLIATQTIKQVSEGGDAVRADLKATASAQDQLAASSNNLAVVTETSARRQTSAAAAFNAMARSMDPAVRAFADLERNQATFGRALSQNSSMLDKAGQDLSVYRDRLNAAAVAAENLRRQQSNASVNLGAGFSPGVIDKNTYASEFASLLDIADQKAMQIGKQFGESLDASMIAGTAKSARESASVFTAELDRLDEISRQKAMQVGKNFQDSLNQSFGIGGSSKSAKDSAAVFEEAAKAQDDMSAAAKRLQAALNPLAAEEAKQAEELALLKKAQEAGLITAEQFAGAQQLSVKRLENLSQSLKTVGTSGRVMSGELVNMGYQLNDVVTGLALGQSPFMIVAQQGGQVVQILQNSKASVGEFASAAVSSFTSLITPTTAAVAGVAALAAGAAYAAAQFDKMQVAAQRAISGAGARTGTTTSDINSFVDKNTPSIFSGGTLSQKESRALGEGLTQTGDIVISKLNSMSAAVVGFSNQTGQSMDEAVKAFVKMGSDPVKAMDELSGVFGPFSQSTRTLVQDMAAAGDKTLAWNAILNELGPTAKGTADNMTVAERATRGFINTLQTAQKPAGIEQQLEDVRTKLNGAIAAAQQFAEHGVEAPPEVSNSIVALNRQFEGLQARIQGVMDLKASGTFNDLADKARVATEAIFPQIDAVRKLDAAIRQLEESKAQGAGGPNADAAIAVYEHQAQLQQQSLDTTVRQAQAAQTLVNVYGGVTQQTAQTLNNLNLQLAVAQQITASGRMQAQAQATYSALVNQGVDASEAQSIASKEFEVSQANATSSVLKQVDALKDQTKMVAAARSGTEAQTAASIAYKNAINSGADSTAAAALKAATLANYMAQSGQSAQSLAGWLDSMAASLDKFNSTGYSLASALSAAKSTISWQQGQSMAEQENAQFAGNGSQFTPEVMPAGPLSFVADPNLNVSYRNGGKGRTIDIGATAMAVQKALAAANDPNAVASSYVSSGNYLGAIRAIEKLQGNNADRVSQVDALTQIMNGMTSDKGAQITNLQSELAWLNTLPETIARDQKINDLTQSIQQLKDSTDSLNSTNRELLSPYYSQDPRTSKIGFRTQGMATGGEVTVPGGYSAHDNMVAQIPVASGEIINVRRPGQSAGGSTTNQTTTINQTFIVAHGTDVNSFGRTAYQETQAALRALNRVA